MNKISVKLQVFFEEPFWVGIYEIISEGRLSVCKITFGAEPKDYEVYEFLLGNFEKFRFSPGVEGETIDKQKINPKRMQRNLKKQMNNTGIGTKAQQALKLQHEQNKTDKKLRNRQQKEEEQKRMFELKQKKKKEKHKGR